LGIAGAIVGSHVAEALGFSLLGQYRDNVAAGIGAIIFLLGWHQTRRKRKVWFRAREGSFQTFTSEALVPQKKEPIIRSASAALSRSGPSASRRALARFALRPCPEPKIATKMT
jgi:hypothetical protein